MRPLLSAAFALALLALPAKGQQPIRQTPEGVILNFQNVDLTAVATALAQAAGVNLVTSNLPEIPVTLRTASPVPTDSVAVVLRMLAESNGVSVSVAGGFMRLTGPAQADDALPPRHLFIYRLRHARATVLANTLRALFGGPQTVSSGGQGPQTLSEQLRAQAQLGGQQQQTFVVPPQVLVGAQGGELEGNVQIVPDETTNALLIRATEGDWATIEQAVEALDLRPLQVVIEVVIAEVSRSEDLNVGLSFSATDDDERTTGELPSTAGEDDFTLQVIRTAGDVDVTATLSALASTGNVRILSRPVIQAQNNQEARILVGDERPFVQVSRTLPTDQGARDEIVQYRDVGTALTILPTINDEGYVNLYLTQEVSSATSETQFGAPVISTREAETQLLARTGQTVVIGGLVDQQAEEVRSGIPFLKDIPVLGWLFGTTREAVSNSELFLFLTPYIVASDQDAATLKNTIEENAELLEQVVPIRSILPPDIPPLVPDTSIGGPGGPGGPDESDGPGGPGGPDGPGNPGGGS